MVGDCLSSGKYECSNPPCVHVVVDWPRRRFAVFVEDAEGSLLYIPADRVVKACRELDSLLRKRVREAKNDEIDDLADKYLNAIVFTDTDIGTT